MNDYVDEVLYEMNLSNLTPIRISTNRLYVDRPTIFLTLPDTNVSIQTALYTSGLLLTNCDGIVTQNRIVKIVRHNYNGKVRFLDLKKYFIATKPIGGKKLRVLSTIPSTKDNYDKNFYFYDLGLYSDALKTMTESFTPKIATQYLFSELMKIYTNVKNSNPTYRVEILLLAKDNKGFLYELFKNIKVWVPEDEIEKLECYDNFILASNCNNIIAPIFKKEKLKPALQYPNIFKFINYLDSQAQVEEEEQLKITNSKEQPSVETKTNQQPNSSIFSKIVDSLKSNKLVNGIDDDGNVNIGIDNRQLTQTLSKYKIKDPDIVANVKAALDTYVKDKGAKLTKDEAESAVLKAINYTVHGKEELDEEYLAHPNRLIEKLAQTRTHKTPLQFPDTETSIIKPKDVIDIDYTTGVWRQKQEFENTIHKNVKRLFDSLQNVSNAPIKIKKIDHHVIDDEQNRLINYKITLQNTGGGTKDLYQVDLNVPAPVNDRYFKLRGSQYIMATQQFFKPVTKTDKNEVRILSNYAIVRIQLQNLKFNPANNDDLIGYIQTRYPTIIKQLDNKSCTLDDGSIIYFSGDIIFKHDNEEICIDEDTGRLTNQDDVKLPMGKNEFIYEKLRNRVLAANPEDRLTKTKKSIPYFQFYIGGIKLPLILYLWQLQGLVKTLSDSGIEYKITESPNPEDIVVKMSEGKWLAMYPNNLRERLLCNGILAAKIKDEIPDLNNPSAIYPFIEKTYGARTVLQLRIMTQNMIDPVTKEMLEFENLSTNLPNLVTTRCIDILLNQKPDKLSDLKLYRARMSEIILNIMYKQLMMAHNTYHQKVEEFNDPNAKLVLMPDFILNEIITTAGVLQYTEAANPVDEIGLASRTIKTGPGGVPNHRAFKVEHRNIHPSQYGIMSAVMTPEHSSVGLVVSHTLTPVIVNELGSYGNKDLATMKKYGTLSINEALTPFQNEMD